MTTTKVSKGAALALGISKPQIETLHRSVDDLERMNQAVGLTRVRQDIDLRLVEIRLLLRDGHLLNLNRSGERIPEDFSP